MKPLKLFIACCTIGLCMNAVAQDTNTRPKKPQLDDTSTQPKDTMKPQLDKKYKKGKASSIETWNQYVFLKTRNNISTKEEILTLA